MREVVGSLLLAVGVSFAHFLVVKPEADIVRKPFVKVESEFTHPAEGYPAMHYQIERSGVFVNGRIYPIEWEKGYIPAMPGSSLKVEKYTANIRLHGPGVYQIFVEQKPYFEPTEGQFIQQIAKVYISAFGWEEGWDKPIGLPVEIVPLTRPFGLWEGNTFVGRVLKNGKPVPHARVEIEYYNSRGVKYPNELLYTQVVKTDQNGVFIYTVPWSGWWGFAAITDGGTLKNTSDGKEYPLELDAVIWIYAYPKPQGVK